MASRLDSTPQSPESGHNTVRLDQTPPSVTANTTIMDLVTESTPMENGPDETTHLLNEQNTANHHSQLENSIWHTHTHTLCEEEVFACASALEQLTRPKETSHLYAYYVNMQELNQTHTHTLTDIPKCIVEIIQFSITTNTRLLHCKQKLCLRVFVRAHILLT